MFKGLVSVGGSILNCRILDIAIIVVAPILFSVHSNRDLHEVGVCLFYATICFEQNPPEWNRMKTTDRKKEWQHSVALTLAYLNDIVA